MRQFALLAPALIVIAYDVRLWWAGRPTITAFVRARPRVGYLAAAVYGGLFVHFFLWG